MFAQSDPNHSFSTSSNRLSGGKCRANRQTLAWPVLAKELAKEFTEFCLYPAACVAFAARQRSAPGRALCRPVRARQRLPLNRDVASPQLLLCNRR
jgi:hypothetical protein